MPEYDTNCSGQSSSHWPVSSLMYIIRTDSAWCFENTTRKNARARAITRAGIRGRLDVTLGSIVRMVEIFSMRMMRVQYGVTCCMNVPFPATM